MAFSSIVYILILLGTCILYYLLPKSYRFMVLLTVSVFFYFLCAGKYILFILFSAVSIFFAGIKMGKEKEKLMIFCVQGSKEENKAKKESTTKKNNRILFLAVAANLSILIISKYYGMGATWINALFSFVDLPFTLVVRNFALALGISFYTLQGVGYLIDVNRGKIKAETNPFKFMLFLMFFPNLVEGPICRYEETADQLYNGNHFSYKNICFGMQRFCWGMFKKMVIADRLNILVNQIMANYQNYSGVLILVVMVAYTCQLYVEFSGAMDMVIGGAQLFGVQLPENFNFPFAAKTIQEYWRRWHMTLGGWFKDYVFYTVSLSKIVKQFAKKVKKRKTNEYTKLTSTFIGLFVVWTLTGLWHGASHKYLFYGWYYFLLITLGLLLEPGAAILTKKFSINRQSKSYILFQRIRTFILINIGLLLFRCGSFEQFIHMLRSIPDDFQLIYLVDSTMLRLGLDYMDYFVLFFGMGAVIVIQHLRMKGMKIRESVAGFAVPVRFGLYYLLILSILLFGAYGFGYQVVGFIYANF